MWGGTPPNCRVWHRSRRGALALTENLHRFAPNLSEICTNALMQLKITLAYSTQTINLQHHGQISRLHHDQIGITYMRFTARHINITSFLIFFFKWLVGWFWTRAPTKHSLMHSTTKPPSVIRSFLLVILFANSSKMSPNADGLACFPESCPSIRLRIRQTKSLYANAVHRVMST